MIFHRNDLSIQRILSVQNEKIRLNAIVSGLLLTVFCYPHPTLAQLLTITPTAVTIVEGDSENLTVVLSSEPTEEIIVTILRQGGAEIRLDSDQLTFTPANWNVPQTVRLMAVEDEDSKDKDGTLILIASGDGLVGDAITLSPDTTIITSLGETAQLAAVVQDQEGEDVSGLSLEWSSADPSIATVDSDGKVTAVGFGETVITASLATTSGSATILISDPSSLISPDRKILEELFQATEGEGWTNRDNWLTDAPIREWNGVTEDAEGYVTELYLFSNNLSGHIPSSLGKLHRLKKLLLSDNSLTGSIPAELGNIEQLETLYLQSNGLTGTIPPELGRLIQLDDLNLGHNSLTGQIPPELGNLAELKYLVLSRNSLTEPIPLELANLKQLEELRLDSNELTGTIPPELVKLTELKNLALQGNDLSGLIPSELGNLARLEVLHLYHNSLTGSIPPELGNLTQLTQLYLGSNKLAGSIPSELSNLAALKVLDISWNSLTEPIPPELGNLTQLQELHLYRNSLTGSIPPELSNLAQLKVLDLTANDLTGSIPAELGDLAQLKVLRLTENELTGSIPAKLGDLAQLKVLRLAENELTGSIPPELGNLSQLEEFRLSENDLTGAIPRELSDLKQLKKLWLFENELTGSIPSELGNLVALTELYVYENQLSGSIPPELGSLVQLKTLSLFKNDLTGSIPPELGNLIQLESLTLSLNSITGPIPPELGRISTLELLYLDRNKFSGPIPPELGRLTQLNTLWLFENDLTGPIPPEFGNLEKLEKLNLSENSLSGQIPSEFSNLKLLNILDLKNNKNMEGFLPRSFLSLNLGFIDIEDTGICVPQDTIFQTWWNNLSDGIADDCTLEKIERLSLVELYNTTNGASWTNTAEWGSSEPLNNWYGVTVRNKRVTELSLPNNGLSGPIPNVVANFTELTVLNLAGNSLTGALTQKILPLSELTELYVNGNADLEGILDNVLINHLAKLEVLHFGGTSLCASPTPKFQAWYAGLNDASGQICGNPDEVRLNIPVAYLTQSIQTPKRSVRLIEGRDALLRVFVTGEPAPAFFEHDVVATIHAGSRTHQVEITRAGSQLLTAADESDLDNSFNTVIPGDFILSGATLVVEADPDGVIPRAAGSQDRFPAVGEEQLNVVSVPAMEVTVVPVLEANEPDRSIFEWTSNVSDNSPEVGLFKYAFPFHEFRARSRETYITSLDLTTSNGQWRLVLELEALRLMDNATGYYYGAAASVNGYVRGRARRGGWTSMGKAQNAELAHEIGHNLNLAHAPCGGAGNTDPNYPHADGSVGAWGFDFRDSTLISPKFHRDIMGYCFDQGWISDYYFEKVIDFRERLERKEGQPMNGAPLPENVLVLWGGGRDGELWIEPPFQITAPAQLPKTSGSYRLEGLGQQNDVLFSLSFTPGDDKFGHKYFFFAIPIEPEWEESLAQIVLSNPEQSVTVDTNDQRALSILRDANTGQVRGILRDYNGDLPAALEQINDLNITTIQGLKDSVRLER